MYSGGVLGLAVALLLSRQVPRPLLDGLTFTIQGAAVATPVADGVRLDVSGEATATPYGITASLPVRGPLAAGRTVLFSARMRSPDAVRLAVALEEGAPPYPKAFLETLRLAPEWRTVRFAGVVPRDFAAPRLALWLGYGPGRVELADVRLDDLGTKPLAELALASDPYGGEPNPDDWRKAALARIERIRKGDLVVHVVDAAGRPVPGARVRVHQLRHAFRFGTAAPAALLARQDATGTRYRATLARLFNTVTFENDLKWNSLEDAPSPDVATAFAWLDAHGIQARAHNLVWGSRKWLPRGLWEESDADVKAAVARRIATAVARYRGRVYLWDVVNEAVTERELWDRLGDDWIARCFELAHRADPTVRLAYNDFDLTEAASAGSGHLRKTEALLARLVAAHAPFDTIGIQSHVVAPLTPTKRVLEILDELARFGKRLEITEYDLSLLDDDAHGRHMADYLTACFSHPAVDAFVMWGFWQGAHWRAAEGGAMFRQDWSPRPAALAYEELVKRRWWTDATVRTDARGDARLRAFYGAHEATVGGRATRIELAKGGPARFVVRLP